MNFKRLINLFTRVHKKGSETQPDEFLTLVQETKDVLFKAKEHCLTVSPRDYYRVNVNSEMDNLGVAIECLTELHKAMCSTGNDKYIDVPTFNNGFSNSQATTLDRLLVDRAGQWIRYDDTLDTLGDLVYQIELKLLDVDSKMVDYYRGHTKRILTRVYNIFKQI